VGPAGKRGQRLGPHDPVAPSTDDILTVTDDELEALDLPSLKNLMKMAVLDLDVEDIESKEEALYLLRTSSL
jgi:hypothetical protein